MKVILKAFANYLLRVHWKRVFYMGAGAFLTAASVYLYANVDTKAPLTFALIGRQLEGAACAGLLATLPVVGGLLTNSVKDKPRAVAPNDYDSTERDPLDEAIPPK